MTPTSQFKAIAKLLRQAVDQADNGAVPVDTVKRILLVTEKQVEAAELGLLEEEEPQ